VDKVNNNDNVDMNTLMSSQPGLLSREAQLTNSLVVEGLIYVSKKLAEGGGSGEDTDDDYYIVTANHNGEFEYIEDEDDDEEEDKQVDEEEEGHTKKSRAFSFTGGTLIGPGIKAKYNTMAPNSYRQVQYGEEGGEEDLPRPSLNRSLSNKIPRFKHTLSSPQFKDLTNVDTPPQSEDSSLQVSSLSPYQQAPQNHITPRDIGKSESRLLPRSNTVQQQKKDFYELTGTQPRRTSGGTNGTIKIISVKEKENHKLSPQQASSISLVGNANQISSPRDMIEQPLGESQATLVASDSDDRGPILPPDIIPRMRQGTVLYTFEPENPGEIAVEADELIEVIEVKGEWIECLTKDRMRHGWVPFNYVQIQEKEITI